MYLLCCTLEVLKPLSDYLRAYNVVQIIKVIHDLPVGASWDEWFVNNLDKRNKYFKEPYPYAAVVELGYPNGDAGEGGFASMFNLPPEE